MKIEVVVFWAVTPCTDVVGYQHAASKTLLSYHITTQCHRPQDRWLKRVTLIKNTCS